MNGEESPPTQQAQSESTGTSGQGASSWTSQTGPPVKPVSPQASAGTARLTQS